MLRRTAIDGSGPFTADDVAIPQAIGASETPTHMMVSEDGGTLFLITATPSSSTYTYTYTFRALPLA